MFLGRIIILLFFLVIYNTAYAKTVVLDGDSIRLNKKEIRLIGVDAPEYKQQCFDANEQPYNCGDSSKEFLENLLKDKEVKCIKVKKDIYKRDLSECFIDDNVNINIELLKSGWAIIYYKNNDALYVEAQREAQENKRGVWQGRFMKPEFFRLLKN